MGTHQIMALIMAREASKLHIYAEGADLRNTFP